MGYYFFGRAEVGFEDLRHSALARFSSFVNSIECPLDAILIIFVNFYSSLLEMAPMSQVTSNRGPSVLVSPNTNSTSHILPQFLPTLYRSQTPVSGGIRTIDPANPSFAKTLAL